MTGPGCGTCGDTGMLARYASQWNDPQTIEEAPCPEPDCAHGAFERGEGPLPDEEGAT